MGWMDKFRKKDDDGAARQGGQGSLPGELTDADRAAILHLTQQAFAERGREVVPDGRGGLHGADGRSFGTANLEATLRQAPREHWRAIVANHVRIMDGTIDQEARSLDEVRTQVYLRLREQAALPRSPDYDSRVLPGIVGMVAIDYPEHTEELGNIDALGSWEEIRALAMENIRRLPAMTHHAVLADQERADSAIHVFTTDDFFGPSRYFALDQLLAQAGSNGTSPGLLLAIPNRHMIALHEIGGPGTVVAMNGMINLALGQHQSQPGALSPHVFFVGRDGTTQQATAHADGRVAVEVKGALAEAFERGGVAGS